jgi:hypothetical protein
MTRQEQITQMRAEGKTWEAIGQALGISRQRVMQVASKCKPPQNQEPDNTAQPITQGQKSEYLQSAQLDKGIKAIQQESTDIQESKDTEVLTDLGKARSKIVKAIIDGSRSLKKERVQSLVVSAGIIIDKMRLMQGDPTAIFRHQSIIADLPDDVLRRIAGVDVLPTVCNDNQADNVDNQGVKGNGV